MTGMNSGRGPKELDTKSGVRAVKQDDPSHGDQTQRIFSDGLPGHGFPAVAQVPEGL